MSQTYQTTGIILKGMPLGEADRLVTLLSPEYGLIQAVAPGARKYKSRLRGRSELFVVNQLMIVKGRSLDKITQAETLESYLGLSKDLGKLAAAQYLAEMVLCLALSGQPQTELYELLTEHLRRLNDLSLKCSFYDHLAQAVFHLLAVTGIAPQVHACCLTQEPLTANFGELGWRVGFSFEAGGMVDLTAREKAISQAGRVPSLDPPALPPINIKLGAVEVTLLQHLGNSALPEPIYLLPDEALNGYLEASWVRVEHLLREYAQYQVGRSFRSATLVDALSPLAF